MTGILRQKDGVATPGLRVFQQCVRAYDSMPNLSCPMRLSACQLLILTRHLLDCLDLYIASIYVSMHLLTVN